LALQLISAPVLRLVQLLFVALQASPHEVPSQLAVAPVSVGHAPQEAPHDATDVFDEHVLPHA
jgi:hypothetical protein